jgi:transcription-repair coupling factor (superfamily II helicase)
VRDVQIDADVEMHIPSEYVSSVQERLNLYTTLDQVETEKELEHFGDALRDRFGKIPPEVQELFEGLRLRWQAKELGFERIVLKNDKLRCYFVENPQSPFYDSAGFQQVFQFIATQGERLGLHLKKSTRSLILVKDGVKSLKGAKKVLEGIRDAIAKIPA